MRIPSLLSALVGASILSLTACGGSQPAAEEPSAEAKKDDAEAASEDKAEASDAEKKDEKKDEKPADDGSGPKVERTAKDILTAPEVTFMFSFNKSEPKEKAEEKCTKEAKDDPKKMALCMKKASSKFEADGMQFKQEKGQWVWITLRRKGSTLTTLHNIPFEFGEDKEKSVTIKPTGKDTGKQPMKPPAEVKIAVPDEFQIELDDPTHGRMVYEAKIGITSADKGQ
ncbi:MAG TPA: hypothetical protein VGK73_37295 [Polyangiaceae bacterium]